MDKSTSLHDSINTNDSEEVNSRDVSEGIVREEAAPPLVEEPKVTIHRRISEATSTLNDRIKNYKYLLQTVLLIAALIAFVVNMIFSKNGTTTLNQDQFSTLLFKAVDAGPIAMPLKSHAPAFQNLHKEDEQPSNTQ